MSFSSEWKAVYSGKVRELYIPQSASTIADTQELLIVASDRVSAFDHILRPDIPGKGMILTALTHWWLDQLPDIRNHRIDREPPEELAGRAMVVEALEMIPIECVVRGYLAGGGWREYRESGAICGVTLPGGLSEGDPLPEPIFTPTTKAALGDHDENITFDHAEAAVGVDTAREIRQLSLDVYQRAHDIARSRGLILADTKLEFGRSRATGEITLGDEVLTSDSSRYWDERIYAGGGMNRLDSFDKQIIRNWLSSHWDQTGDPPALPPELISLTLERYRELFRRLTGQTPPDYDDAR